MPYDVAIVTSEPLPTAVVPATTTWPQFRTAWKGMLDEVWAWLTANGITSGCRNIMLYLDDRPQVEIGVLLTADLDPPPPIVRSHLPAGSAARTVHRGPYPDLALAHEAVIAWWDERGLHRAGPRWEFYGPNAPIPEVEVVYLLGAA
jgi:effector-binding domain-containing protein